MTKIFITMVVRPLFCVASEDDLLKFLKRWKNVVGFKIIYIYIFTARGSGGSARAPGLVFNLEI
jgi:hypothetical protein